MEAQSERNLTCVLFPGVVKNDEKAIQCLGGIRNISQVYSQIKKSRLGLTYQPDNPFIKKIYGDNRKTAGVLLKVRIKKTKSGDTLNREVVATTVVGRVSTIYKFDSLCDFQYLPIHKEGDGPLKCNIENIYPSGTDPFSFISDPCSLHIVPSNFTRTEKPTNYAYTDKRYYEKHTAEEDDHIHSKRRLVRQTQFNKYDFNLTNELPSEPHAGNLKQKEARLVQYPQLKEEYETIKKMFDERPIWSLNLIKYETKTEDSSLKIILPCLAIYLRKGPWKMVWVRFGYDPRKEPGARIYQTLDFRVRSQAGAKSMVTTRLEHYHKKLELIADPKKAIYESSSEIISEGTVYFRPGVVPTQRQVYYQYCDIKLPEVQALLAEEPAPGYLCHPTRGWLPPDMAHLCRDHIFRYVKETVLASHISDVKFEEGSGSEYEGSDDEDAAGSGDEA